MKALMPLFIVATAGMQAAFASGGLDAYRQGDYAASALKLINESDKQMADYYLGRMRLYGYGLLKNNVLALQHFEKAAEKGYLPAQNIMARFELLEKNNPEKALHWFKKAADANDTQAQMYTAAAYMFGFGTKKNPSIARRYYIAAAKNDNSIAQYTLAEYFLASRNAHNRKLGLIWLNKAVGQGNLNAQLKQGELYAEGKLVSKDLDKAKELLGLAVKQGSVQGMFQMGKLAAEEKDSPAAEAWYIKAAEKNFSPAQVALAELYLNKEGSLYNSQSGFLWMLKAAQNNYKEAQNTIAKMYKEGIVVAKDENLAKEWEQKASAKEKKEPLTSKKEVIAWLGNDKANNFIDSGYQLQGIFSAWQNPNALKENNYNQAPQMDQVGRQALYKPDFTLINPNDVPVNEYYNVLATALGHATNQSLILPEYPIDKVKAYESEELLVPHSPLKRLAAFEENLYPLKHQDETFEILDFISPAAVEENHSQSSYQKLLNQAILGNSNAQFKIGQMHQYGIVVNQDVKKAIQFYEMAANQEDLRAAYTLGTIYLKGEGGALDYQLAEQWLEEAAFKGNAQAQYVLARIKEQGYRDANGEIAIKPDKDESTAMYYIASANDHGLAQFRLAEILIREKQQDMNVAAKKRRQKLIKNLYEGAVSEGIGAAALPLAFFNAMDSSPAKQMQAFSVAKKEAENGNSQAALLLGLLFDRGLGVEKNSAEAIRWYKKSTLNPVSSFILGTYTIQGKNIDPDPKAGKALLQQSADADFSFGNLNLAIVKQQQGEAFISELDAARTSGNSLAGLLLADYYLSLGNSEQNMKQAREIYQYFAEKGDKKAQLKLGFMYEQGLGGPIDYAYAQRWYLLSAEQGQPEAQYMLGKLYQLGWLDKPDYAEAKKWYEKAQVHYSPAAVALGFIYETVDDDYEKALKAYNLAARKGDAVGQFNAGLIYEDGKGQAVDYAKASQLYSLASAKGHSGAMMQLAGIYFNGFAGRRNDQEALNLYEKSARQGNREAWYQLGLLSETGVVVKLNYQNAMNFYKTAAEKGNAKAMLALARMYQYGQGIPKDYEKASEYYKELVKLNNPYAQFQLATLYYDGSLGERNPEEGKRLLLKAEANGNLQARKVLQWIEAQSKERLSYIEPAILNKLPNLIGQPADLMYLDAMNEWNRGDEESSRMILDEILIQFPHYVPAQRAYERLYQPLMPSHFS